MRASITSVIRAANIGQKLVSRTSYTIHLTEDVKSLPWLRGPARGRKTWILRCPFWESTADYEMYLGTQGTWCGQMTLKESGAEDSRYFRTYCKAAVFKTVWPVEQNRVQNHIPCPQSADWARCTDSVGKGVSSQMMPDALGVGVGTHSPCTMPARHCHLSQVTGLEGNLNV